MTHIEGHNKIHLIGIGGCSMSGLARILAARGYSVKGSDANVSPFTEQLEKDGISVAIGQKSENVGDAELVIYSAAIKENNPERVYAREHNIPELERSVALGQLSEGYEKVVGVAGCHGKTTITSMLALISHESKLDATIHVGGFVDFMGGGVSVGSSDVFITEACEYVESFLTLRPTIAIINNIDNDHLDYYGNIENIVNAFRKYLRLLPEDGLFIGCTDDFRVKALMEEFKEIRSISFGMSDAQYTPENIEYDEMGNPSYDLICNGEKLFRVVLNVPGQHSIIDSIAAIVTAIELGVENEPIINALAKYKNTRRRFEFYGERNGIKVFHDYAHHTAEIGAVLSAAARYPHKKLWCVFQCNSYTRAKTLFLDNLDCFKYADEVIVPDIYPGRETDDGSIHAKDMVEAIAKTGVKTEYVSTFEEIRTYIDKNAQSGDIILTLGSGDVYKKTRLLLDD